MIIYVQDSLGRSLSVLVQGQPFAHRRNSALLAKTPAYLIQPRLQLATEHKSWLPASTHAACSVLGAWTQYGFAQNELQKHSPLVCFEAMQRTSNHVREQRIACPASAIGEGSWWPNRRTPLVAKCVRLARSRQDAPHRRRRTICKLAFPSQPWRRVAYRAASCHRP